MLLRRGSAGGRDSERSGCKDAEEVRHKAARCFNTDTVNLRNGVQAGSGGGGAGGTMPAGVIEATDTKSLP